MTTMATMIQYQKSQQTLYFHQLPPHLEYCKWHCVGGAACFIEHLSIAVISSCHSFQWLGDLVLVMFVIDGILVWSTESCCFVNKTVLLIFDRLFSIQSMCIFVPVFIFSLFLPIYIFICGLGVSFVFHFHILNFIFFSYCIVCSSYLLFFLTGHFFGRSLFFSLCFSFFYYIFLPSFISIPF